MIRVLISLAMLLSYNLAADQLTCAAFSTDVQCTDPCTQVIGNMEEAEVECCKKKMKKTVVKWKTKWKTKTKVIEKEKIVEKKVEVEEEYPRNSIGLLFGIARTGLTHSEGDKAVAVRTKHELDLGIYYHRDFAPFRLGIQATVRKNVHLSFGLNF